MYILKKNMLFIIKYNINLYMYIYVNIFRIYTPAGLAKSLARRPGAIV